MRVLKLDASEWTSIHDFHESLAAVIGAPHWHGDSVAAFIDSIIYGEPPYTLSLFGGPALTPDLRAAIKDEIALILEHGDTAKVEVFFETDL